MDTDHMKVAAQFTAAIIEGLREEAHPLSLTQWFNKRQHFDCESNFYKWTARAGTICAVAFLNVTRESHCGYHGEPLYDIGEKLGHWLWTRGPERTDRELQYKLGALIWEFFKSHGNLPETFDVIKREIRIQTGYQAS